MPDDAGTLPAEAARAEERSRTMVPSSPRQWAVAVASAVILLLGGGAGGAFVIPQGDAARLDAIERRLGWLERGTADLRCVSVLGGSVIGECRCKVPDAGVVDLCPPRP